MRKAAEVPSIATVYAEGRKIIGRNNLAAANNGGVILPGSPEDMRFRSHFGVSPQVVVDAWQLMDDHGLLPVNAQLCHFLWALAFMYTYPKNDKALSTLLGKKDPKTMSKYLWPFIQSVFELDDYVVSDHCGTMFLFTMNFPSQVVGICTTAHEDSIREQEETGCRK